MSMWPILGEALGVRARNGRHPRSLEQRCRPGAERCIRCGAPLVGHGIDACPRALGDVVRIAAGGAHAGTRRGLLLEAKFSQQPEALDLLIADLTGALDAAVGLPAPGALVVPIPSSWWAVAWRGGDHVRWVADALAHRYGWVRTDALRKDRGGGPQRGRNRRDRERPCGPDALGFGLRGGLWGPPDGVRGPPRAVVLVDDVLTTGSTLRRAAAALRTRGEPVTAVWGAVLSVED